MATSIRAIVCSPLPAPFATFSKDYLVRQTLKIWNNLRLNLDISDILAYSPLVFRLFPPSLADKAFDIWRQNGVKSLSDLYKDGTFALLKFLSNTFNFPNAHFFRYLQA